MTSFDVESVTAAVQIAERAPSIHNTQPWRWILDDNGLTVAPDPERHLAVADPDGHSMNISVGAAVGLTELALAAQGWQTTTTVDADGTALIVPIGRGAPDPDDEQAVDLALERRSDRRQFAPVEVSEDDMETLRVAGHDGDARIEFPHGRDQRVTLAVVLGQADRFSADDPAYVAEMQHWITDPQVHADSGIPLSNLPHVPEGAQRRLETPQRNFEVGVTGQQLIDTDVIEKPLIAVVLTDADQPRDHIHAGRAMMRLMIAAQGLGLSTCIMSQAVDLPAFRTRVQNMMSWVGHPQVMLRVGRPFEPIDRIPLTPRRPVSAVLEVHLP